MVLLASVTDASVLARLESRIDELIISYPLLGCRISEGRTRRPAFSKADVTSGAILRKGTIGGNAGRDEIMRLELDAGSKLDVHSGPLWRVAVYDDDNSSYIALVVNHVVVDGRGALNLLHSLLAPECPKGGGYAPSVESTIAMRPTWGRIAYEVFWNLLVPRLPRILQPDYWSPVPVPWPGVLPKVPIGCPVGLASITLPATLVPELKLAGQSRGISTIHPIIHTAALAAFLSAQPSNALPLALSAATPISIRSEALGHPHITGNYVAALATDHLLSPSDKFWSIAQEYTKVLKSPAARKEAITVTGTLCLIPDPDRGPNAPTGWEEFWLGEATGPKPYRYSIGVSNIGALPATPGVGEILFTRDPSPIGDAVNILVVGHAGETGGLGITMTWAEGAIDGVIVHKAAKALERILHQVALRTLEESVVLGHFIDNEV